MDERDRQFDFHRATDPAHLSWQTSGPYFSATEAELLARVTCDAGERLLEIGCGEGANLFHLRRLAGTRYGIDFSFNKTLAAAATGAHVACADATKLPFADGVFDVVLIRDLLHHVPERFAVLEEAFRVLRAGGRLHVIEPNGRAPLVLLQALAVRVERGLLRSTSQRLLDELTQAGFSNITLTPRQPFPVERALLHPHFGLPRLGALPAVAGALHAWSTVAEHILPRATWFYLCLEATRP